MACVKALAHKSNFLLLDHDTDWKLAIYEGVSKSSQTGSVEHQLMAVRECGRCGREQGTSPLSMPSGVAL
jgi:hypothetical protein